MLVRLNCQEREIRPPPQHFNLRGISNGVDNIVSVIAQPAQNSLRKNAASGGRAQFVAHFNQDFASNLPTSLSYLFADFVGQRVVFKSPASKVLGDFRL